MEYMKEDIKERENKKQFWKGIVIGAIAAVIITAAGMNIFGIGAGAGIDSDKLRNLKNLVDSNYLYSDNIEEKMLEEGIYKGYFSGLGDQYSEYYTPEEFKQLTQTTIMGEFYGTGIQFTQDQTNGRIIVNGVYEGSPGAKAGVNTGDILKAVDGASIDGMELNEVVSKIKGEQNTQVKLTFISGKDGSEYTRSMTREKITVKTVSGKMLQNSIGYISISEFTQETDKQFDEVFEKLQKDGMKGLVIDLRNNTGGVVDSTCKILDKLLPEGKIVYTKDKHGNVKEETSDGKNYFDKPVALLVNGYTASASEIFTAAMQDYDMGPVIGTKTFGKGIVQQLFPLPDGSGVKLTVSEYFSPKDRAIHGKGIEPDITVEDSRANINDADDAQLKKAVEEVIKAVN